MQNTTRTPFNNISATACRRSAFTLMELQLVLVLLLTISSVVVPAMGRWQRAMPLEQAATLVRNELTRTRILAIEKAVAWSVEIQANGLSFRRFPTASPRETTTFNLPTGVHFVSKTDTLQFLSDGTTSDTIVTLEDAQGIQQQLKLDRLTGTIRKLIP